jgi:two-component system, OmpR family, response regulator ChvI
LAKRILIVDDEEDITDSFKIGLERQGFLVDAYNDPVKTLSEFVPGAYSVIILDIRMPKMNGFELFRALTRIDKGAKICFLTAFEVYKEEFHKLFPDVDVQCFLRKPISISDLSACIRKMTD